VLGEGVAYVSALDRSGRNSGFGYANGDAGQVEGVNLQARGRKDGSIVSVAASHLEDGV
jgi:hypothetical protein